MNLAKPHRFAALLALLWAPWALAQEPVRVEAQRIAPQPVTETVPLTGSVTAEQRALLSSQVAGLVSRLAVDAGDRVRAGDLLVASDPLWGDFQVPQRYFPPRDRTGRADTAF